VRDIHGYLHFDGEDLLVLSAHDDAPVMLNGEAVLLTWTKVRVPCILRFGDAEVAIGVVDDEPITSMFDLPMLGRTSKQSKQTTPQPKTNHSSESRSVSAASTPTVLMNSEIHNLNQAKLPETIVRSSANPLPAPKRNALQALRQPITWLAVAVLLGLAAIAVISVRTPPVAAMTPPTQSRPSSASGHKVATDTQPKKATPSEAVPDSPAPLPTQAAPDKSAVATAADERLAADAIARGDDEAALRFYTALARAKPKNKLFEQARDILQRKVEAHADATKL
jgi:hypothetical protein